MKYRTSAGMIDNQQQESDLEQPGSGNNKYSPGGRELEYPLVGKDANIDPSCVQRTSIKNGDEFFTHNKCMTKMVELLSE